MFNLFDNNSELKKKFEKSMDRLAKQEFLEDVEKIKGMVDAGNYSRSNPVIRVVTMEKVDESTQEYKDYVEKHGEPKGFEAPVKIARKTMKADRFGGENKLSIKEMLLKVADLCKSLYVDGQRPALIYFVSELYVTPLSREDSKKVDEGVYDMDDLEQLKNQYAKENRRIDALGIIGITVTRSPMFHVQLIKYEQRGDGERVAFIDKKEFGEMGYEEFPITMQLTNLKEFKEQAIEASENSENNDNEKIKEFANSIQHLKMMQESRMFEVLQSFYTFFALFSIIGDADSAMESIKEILEEKYGSDESNDEFPDGTILNWEI